MAFASLRPGGRRWRFGDWPVAMQLTVGPAALLTVLVLTVGLALGVYFRTRTTSATDVATDDLLQDSAELMVSLAEGGPERALPDDLTVVVLRCRDAPAAG